jgi:hypothetical protein
MVVDKKAKDKSNRIGALVIVVAIGIFVTIAATTTSSFPTLGLSFYFSLYLSIAAHSFA